MSATWKHFFCHVTELNILAPVVTETYKTLRKYKDGHQISLRFWLTAAQECCDVLFGKCTIMQSQGIKERKWTKIADTDSTISGI